MKNFNVFVSSERKSVTYDNRCTECGTLSRISSITDCVGGERDWKIKIVRSYVYVALSLKGK